MSGQVYLVMPLRGTYFFAFAARLISYRGWAHIPIAWCTKGARPLPMDNGLIDRELVQRQDLRKSLT